MVRQLNELVPFIHARTPKAREILALKCDDKKEIMDIYDLFVRQSFPTNQEAADALPNLQLTSFKKYAGQLIKILIELCAGVTCSPAFNLDQDQSIRDIMAMRILEGNGCKNAAREIAKNVLQKGLELERPAWGVEAARLLMRTYANAGYDKVKEFEYYMELAHQLEETLRWQQKSEDYYALFLARDIRKLGVSQDLLDFLTKAEQELRPQAGSVPSSAFHHNYFGIAYHAYFLSGQYEAAAEVMARGLEYFNTRSYEVSYVKAPFYYRISFCMRMLRQYEASEANILQALELSAKGTYNWCVGNQVYFYLCMHRMQLDKAVEIYHKVTHHRQFANFNTDVQEAWHIMGAYLYISIQLQGRDDLLAKIRPYRSARFLNEVRTYLQDKNGMNVAIQVAHLLLLVLEGQLHKAFDRIDALEKYRERYLLDGNSPRSELFVKMLCAIAKEGGMPARFLPKAMPMIAKLAASDQTDGYQPFEQEIIPYHLLGKMLVQHLAPNAALSQVT